MYAILVWIKDSYITFLQQENGSIKIFETIKEADETAEKYSVDSRVISTEGVKA